MITALILSGGTGSRLKSDIPKQYIEVGGRTIISYCIETFSKCKCIDNLWIVAADEWKNVIDNDVKSYDENNKFKGFSIPGKNRQLSIYNGIKDIDSQLVGTSDDLVIIHDAARPLITENDINGMINALDDYDGVMPVLPMKDTVYLSEDGKIVSSLLERKKIFAGQAPELFNLKKYVAANEKMMDQIMNINGSTEVAVMAGMNISMIAGNEMNYKITTNADLERFRQLVNI